MVVPAVLPKSRKELAEKLAVLARIPGVSRIQIDVVDGAFASPPSWPYNTHVRHPMSYMEEVEDMAMRHELLPRAGQIEYEVDLMSLDAEEAAGQWLALGVSRLTLHAASAASLPHFLKRMEDRYRGAGGPEVIAFGLALSLGTEPSLIEPHLGHIQYVQFMGIETIGRQGEPFDPRVLARVREFRATHPHIPIQVDGGVSLTTAPLLTKAGATDLVVGSAIVKLVDPAAAFAQFDAL